MKRNLSFIYTAFLVALAVFHASGSRVNAQMPQAQTDDLKNERGSEKKAFVLLELFTSEGCPTCPPADANLAFLEREQPFAGTEIITLALHVDYWNSLKWKDLYSSPIFSRRQQLYSHALKINLNYTPQMVVDGRTEFIGSNIAKAQKAILEAAKIPKATITISRTTDKFRASITDVPRHDTATVFLAMTEDNVAANRKYGKANERKNAHMSVVRELKSIAMLPAEQSDSEIEFTVQIQPEWKREKLKLVIFIQENASRKILGAARINF